MELTKIKEFIKVYRRPLIVLRILLAYWVFLFVAINTSVFYYGVTKGILNISVSVLVMFYRFLSITFVPAILVLWFFEIVRKRRKI